jgi:hypothetical protein
MTPSWRVWLRLVVVSGGGRGDTAEVPVFEAVAVSFQADDLGVVDETEARGFRGSGSLIAANPTVDRDCGGSGGWVRGSERSVSAVLGPFPGCVEDGGDEPGDVGVVEAGDGVAQVDGDAAGEAG